MTELTSPAAVSELEARFPEWITADARPAYEGFLVEPEHLLEVVQSIRDDLGYDYLSSVTGVDYFPEELIEVVYHFYKTTGGPSLVLKTQTDRKESVVPSLVSLYTGAEFQEREAWDLLGIRFDHHPDLRRILILCSRIKRDQ